MAEDSSVPPTSTPTMRAMQFSEHGPSSVLKLVTVPRPVPGKGQVLVKTAAAGINPVDYKMRDGFGIRLANPRLPCIPGGDLAGVVEQADASSAYKPGDRAMGLTGTAWGCYAEYVTIPAASLARIPEGVSFEQAAALPLAGLTAYQALELARLKEGQRVLIHAGAGGCGTFAIQIAKARGLHVATTCSTKNVDFVKQLGADEVVDYTQQQFDEVYKGNPFDAVLDTMVLNGYEERSLSVLKKSGTYVHFLPKPLLGQIAKGFLKGVLGLGPRYRVVLVMPNGRQLAELAALVEAGKLKPIVHSVLPLEQAAEAQDQIKEGHTRGKIILKVSE